MARKHYSSRLQVTVSRKNMIIITNNFEDTDPHCGASDIIKIIMFLHVMARKHHSALLRRTMSRKRRVIIINITGIAMMIASATNMVTLKKWERCSRAIPLTMCHDICSPNWAWEAHEPETGPFCLQGVLWAWSGGPLGLIGGPRTLATAVSSRSSWYDMCVQFLLLTTFYKKLCVEEGRISIGQTRFSTFGSALWKKGACQTWVAPLFQYSILFFSVSKKPVISEGHQWPQNHHRQRMHCW